jgi:hypothetical protein
MSTSVLKLARPTRDHALAIAAGFRPADRAEAWLSHQYAPLEALEVSMARSKRDSYTVLAGDEPIAMFGVGIGSLIANTGVPWLLGTKGMDDHRQELAAMSRPLVQYLRGGYARLENWAYSANIRSIRWLALCGFTIEPEAPFGPFNAPFRRFWMTRED